MTYNLLISCVIYIIIVPTIRLYTIISGKTPPPCAIHDMTNFITLSIVNMSPFHLGIGSSSARKTWSPARIRPLDSLWNPASECTASTIFLTLYTISYLGQVDKYLMRCSMASLVLSVADACRVPMVLIATNNLLSTALP